MTYSEHELAGRQYSESFLLQRDVLPKFKQLQDLDNYLDTLWQYDEYITTD